VSITGRDYAGREASERNSAWFWQSSFIPEVGVAAAVAAVGVTGVVISRRRRDAAEPDLPY
jgi:hypothetical protein